MDDDLTMQARRGLEKCRARGLSFGWFEREHGFSRQWLSALLLGKIKSPRVVNIERLLKVIDGIK